MTPYLFCVYLRNLLFLDCVDVWLMRFRGLDCEECMVDEIQGIGIVRMYG